MSYNAFSCFLYWINNSFSIPRENCSQINNFNWYSCLLSHFCCHPSNSHLEPIGYQSNIWAFLKNFSFPKWNFKIFQWNFFLSNSVECLWFKEQSWILASDATQKKSFSLDWASWHDNYKAWSVCKIRFRRLWMIMSSMSNSTIWWSEGKTSTVKFVSRSISIFSSFINNLIKSWENVISKLHFSNSCTTWCCCSNCKSSNTLFGKWSIEYSICSVFVI